MTVIGSKTRRFPNCFSEGLRHSWLRGFSGRLPSSRFLLRTKVRERQRF